jgi:hypothetical protein
MRALGSLRRPSVRFGLGVVPPIALQSSRDGFPMRQCRFALDLVLDEPLGGYGIIHAGREKGACYGLVQYSRFSARSASGRPFCRRTAAETATNSYPTTLCLRSGVPDGAAANAVPIVPPPGVANGLPRLRAQVTRDGVPPPARGGVAERGYKGYLPAAQVPREPAQSPAPLVIHFL